MWPLKTLPLLPDVFRHPNTSTCFHMEHGTMELLLMELTNKKVDLKCFFCLVCFFCGQNSERELPVTFPSLGGDEEYHPN